MAEGIDLNQFDRELEELSNRIAALRSTHECFPEDATATLQAALVELELAEDRLRACREEFAAQQEQLSDDPGAGERQLLRTVFLELPIPVLLLDPEGSIRRGNRAAGDLFGTSIGAVTGKPFSLYVDLRRRAALRSRLSAVVRSGEVMSFDTRLVRRGWAEDVHLTLSRHLIPSEPHPIVLAVMSPPVTWSPDETSPIEREVEDQVVVAAARRLDVMARMTRLLLEERSLREPVALRRAARLLATEYADWVVLDLLGSSGVQRTVVAAPEDRDSGTHISLLESIDPTSSEVPAEVLQTGDSVLHQLVENERALGLTEDRLPVLKLLDAGSLLSVPLRDKHEVIGALTLVRRSNRGSFHLADLGLLEELGEHLGLGIRAERSLPASPRPTS